MQKFLDDLNIINFKNIMLTETENCKATLTSFFNISNDIKNLFYCVYILY